MIAIVSDLSLHEIRFRLHLKDNFELSTDAHQCSFEQNILSKVIIDSSQLLHIVAGEI